MKRKVNIVQDVQSRAARVKQEPRFLQARASVSQDVIPSVMDKSEEQPNKAGK